MGRNNNYVSIASYAATISGATLVKKPVFDMVSVPSARLLLSPLRHPTAIIFFLANGFAGRILGQKPTSIISEIFRVGHKQRLDVMVDNCNCSSIQIYIQW